MFLTRIFSAEVKLKPYTFKKNQFSDNKNKSKEIIRFWCIFISWLRTWINWIKKPITGKIAQHGDTEFSDERMNFLGQHLPIILHWQYKTYIIIVVRKIVFGWVAKPSTITDTTTIITWSRLYLRFNGPIGFLKFLLVWHFVLY